MGKVQENFLDHLFSQDYLRVYLRLLMCILSLWLPFLDYLLYKFYVLSLDCKLMHIFDGQQVFLGCMMLVHVVRLLVNHELGELEHGVELFQVVLSWLEKLVFCEELKGGFEQFERFDSTQINVLF